MHATMFFIIQLCFLMSYYALKFIKRHFLKTQSQIFEAKATSGETEAPWFILQ